jgi:hypothetical protein
LLSFPWLVIVRLPHSNAADFSVPMKSRLTKEKVPDEASNHLARSQTSPLGFSFQRHRLVAGQEHGQLDHIIIQRTNLLSLGIQSRF